MNYDQTGIQLYDLEQDVSETRNQSAQHPDLVKHLQQAVNDWNSGLPADAGDPNWRPKKKPAKTGKAKAAN